MNLYIVESKDNSDLIAQLIRLNSECVSLHWSRSISDLSEEVVHSLDVLEDYIDQKIKTLCCDNVVELSDEEEKELLDKVKGEPNLRSILGAGVIRSGDEAAKVLELIGNDNKLTKICQAIGSGKTVVLF